MTNWCVLDRMENAILSAQLWMVLFPASTWFELVKCCRQCLRCRIGADIFHIAIFCAGFWIQDLEQTNIYKYANGMCEMTSVSTLLQYNMHNVEWVRFYSGSGFTPYLDSACSFITKGMQWFLSSVHRMLPWAWSCLHILSSCSNGSNFNDKDTISVLNSV